VGLEEQSVRQEQHFLEISSTAIFINLIASLNLAVDTIMGTTPASY